MSTSSATLPAITPVKKARKPLPRKTIAERMAGKYTINIKTGCHEWKACLSSQAGYPLLGGVDGPKKPQYAYRIAWEPKNGSVPTSDCPDGSRRWELHHTCENKSCVNPDHVELLTSRQHAKQHATLRKLKAMDEAIEKKSKKAA